MIIDKRYFLIWYNSKTISSKIKLLLIQNYIIFAEISLSQMNNGHIAMISQAAMQISSAANAASDNSHCCLRNQSYMATLQYLTVSQAAAFLVPE
jgi:hypothetical protein